MACIRPYPAHRRARPGCIRRSFRAGAQAGRGGRHWRARGGGGL